MNGTGIRAVALAIAICASATGCQSFQAYCQELVDCEGGNDMDVEYCVTTTEREAMYASEYGCSSEFNQYFDCVEAESSCEDSGGVDIYTPEDRCEAELNEFSACMSM